MKSEKYKGVKIIFRKINLDGFYQRKNKKSGGYYPAVRNPIGVEAFSEGFGSIKAINKEEAFKKMKISINNTIKYEKTPNRIKNRIGGVERLMINEWR